VENCLHLQKDKEYDEDKHVCGSDWVRKNPVARLGKIGQIGNFIFPHPKDFAMTARKNRSDQPAKELFLEHAADEPLGLEGRYTIGLRRIAVRTGANAAGVVGGGFRVIGAAY
jgi:hypothetical protein